MLFLVLCSIIFVLCDSRSIGIVNGTRFISVDRLNSDTIWINNQFSPKQCLCTVLSRYNTVLLLNSYSNGSCQLFYSLPYTYTMEYNINSTIILLSSLPPMNVTPCCSSLTWLITRMNNSALPAVNMSAPTYVVIDDLNYLAILSNNNKVYRYNRTTMALISTTSFSVTPILTTGSNNPMSLSYYNKQYFITQGSNSSSTLNIYSTANFTNTATISITKDPRDYVFIRNGSVMVVAIQTPTSIAFYNVTSSISYILMFTLTAPQEPNTLYRVNDTLLYMTTATNYDPVYTLTYNSTTNSWTWGSMLPTKSSLTNNNFQSTIDACGRLWVSINGYGIRIFDTYGTKSLYNWTLSDGLNGIMLTKNFDLYLADYYHNQVLSYRPGIKQCTS